MFSWIRYQTAWDRVSLPAAGGCGNVICHQSDLMQRGRQVLLLTDRGLASTLVA
jgi:hypothetical protein